MIDPTTPAIRDPDVCHTMTDVRAAVDTLDAELVVLLARRFAYMRAAARIKPTHDAVRDETRKAAVIRAATEHAEQNDAPAAAIGRLWEHLVEESIAYEAEEWLRLRA